MKFFIFFLSLGFFFVLLQSTFLHLVPGPVVPDLVLVLCVYWGLNRPTVGAVLGSFILGYSVDVVSSSILGINAFAMSVVFLAAYLTSRSIWVHNPLLSAAVVFFASCVKVAALLIVWILFISTDGPWMGVVKYIFFEALWAAVLAPWLFSLLRRSQSYLEKVRVPL